MFRPADIVGVLLPSRYNHRDPFLVLDSVSELGNLSELRVCLSDLHSMYQAVDTLIRSG